MAWKRLLLLAVGLLCGCIVLGIAAGGVIVGAFAVAACT